MTTDFPKCVGCGYCCKKVQCFISHAKYGLKDECPDLREHDGRFWCGVYEDAGELERVQYDDALAMNEGCTSNMNTDRLKYL